MPQHSEGEAWPLVLGAALPAGLSAPPGRCWQALGAWAQAWLAPEELAHAHFFADATQGRSRLLVRWLLLFGLRRLGLDERACRASLHALGRRPCGAPLLAGWQLSFSHSGQAAFCALRRAGPAQASALGLDAEALNAQPPARRAFSPREGALLDILPPAAAHREALRRWTIKEAALKALGLGLRKDPACLAPHAASRRAGRLIPKGAGGQGPQPESTLQKHKKTDGQTLHWRLLPCPGHWLCLAWTQAPAALAGRPEQTALQSRPPGLIWLSGANLWS